VPTRLARHGTVLAPLPEKRFRFDLSRPAFAGDGGPLVEGCPCPTCAHHSRAYLHYLARAEEPTAARLLTLHNLTFLERLVAGARAAISAGRFAAYRKAVLSGAPPWSA
jgi:queuine tRNA-ribosyltransferase